MAWRIYILTTNRQHFSIRLSLAAVDFLGTGEFHSFWNFFSVTIFQIARQLVILSFEMWLSWFSLNNRPGNSCFPERRNNLANGRTFLVITATSSVLQSAATRLSISLLRVESAIETYQFLRSILKYVFWSEQWFSWTKTGKQHWEELRGSDSANENIEKKRGW